MDQNDSEVTNNVEACRFELEVNGEIAILEYSLAGSNILYTHTEVPPALEGQGIGNKLAHAAMTYAREQGLKVQAVCPFVSNYVAKRPEYHDMTWGFKPAEPRSDAGE